MMHRLVLIAALCLSAVVAVDLGKSDIERRDFGESVERDLGKKSYKSSPDHYKESKDSKSGGGKDSKSGGGSGSKGSKSGGGSSKGSKSSGGGSGPSKGR
jgi:hypothetical protein